MTKIKNANAWTQITQGSDAWNWVVDWCGRQYAIDQNLGWEGRTFEADSADWLDSRLEAVAKESRRIRTETIARKYLPTSSSFIDVYRFRDGTRIVLESGACQIEWHYGIHESLLDLAEDFVRLWHKDYNDAEITAAEAELIAQAIWPSCQRPFSMADRTPQYASNLLRST